MDESCEWCGGELVLLGVLGHLTHYRCRDCGADVAVEERWTLCEEEPTEYAEEEVS